MSAKPLRSASIILHRRTAALSGGIGDVASEPGVATDGSPGQGRSELEVFLVRRAPGLRAWGDYLVFPGGTTEADDTLLPVCGKGDADERELRACGLRELFEETGLLMTAPMGTERVAQGKPTFVGNREVRRALLKTSDGEEQHRILRDELERTSRVLDGTALTRVARLVTPPYMRRRYDTTFFAVEAFDEPEVIPGELVAGAWHRPVAVLEKWRVGEEKIAAPVVAMLEILAAHPPASAFAALADLPPMFEGSGRVILTQPGYGVIPCETPPLPPHLPTNTFLVGEKRFFVIDPGPRGDPGLPHILTAVDARLARGDQLEAILLTHHHRDHVGGLEALVQRYGAPVWGHRKTGELLERPLDRELDDGAEVVLGRAPSGVEGWQLEALFTPGHAAGHLCFYDALHRTLIGGDLLSTLVSMYVGSPGGCLRDYFASLERVDRLAVDTFYPSHGALTHRLDALLRKTLLHRRARLEEVHGNLSAEPRSVEDVARAVYARELDSSFAEFVVRATRATLEHLVFEGRARAVPEDRFARLG